jgi:predicted dehydrogenase
MLNLGIIGYGYWGPNLVRNFSEADGAQVLMVADLKKSNLEKAKKRYPSIQTTLQPQDIFKNPLIDAVAIATPVSSHFDLCMEAFQSGKHVFVEKPLAFNSQQVLRLIEEAEKRKLVLFVDHTFIYTGAVRKIKELVETGQLGRIYYYDSVRVNLGLFQHDVNVLWDLAVHDLTIMNYVLGKKPIAVTATGISHVPGEPENIAYLTCFFGENMIAHIHANWLAPVKIRQTLIGGDKKMIVYDDVEVTEKIKVYDKGIVISDQQEKFYKLMVDYRAGDIWTPHLDMTEALKTEAAAFLECIQTGKKSLSDGWAGLSVVHILEKASQSISQRGNPVSLEWDRYSL